MSSYRKYKDSCYLLIYINSLVQDCGYSIADAQELLWSSAKPLMSKFTIFMCNMKAGLSSLLFITEMIYFLYVFRNVKLVITWFIVNFSINLCT